jgi:hypothetical protein
VTATNPNGAGIVQLTNTAATTSGTYTMPNSVTTASNLTFNPANTTVRTASTAGEVFVSDGSTGQAFINGLIFAPAGSFSFYNSASVNSRINDGAIVQSINIQGSQTDPVPIQISPTRFAGNRHVWITLRDTQHQQVVARIEALILDNHGWSPASGFQILSVTKG